MKSKVEPEKKKGKKRLIQEMLKGKKSLKKALLLSEILKRRQR